MGWIRLEGLTVSSVQRHGEGDTFSQHGNTLSLYFCFNFIVLYFHLPLSLYLFLYFQIIATTAMGSLKSPGLSLLLLSFLLYIADSYPNIDLSNSKNCLWCKYYFKFIQCFRIGFEIRCKWSESYESHSSRVQRIGAMFCSKFLITEISISVFKCWHNIANRAVWFF